MRAMILAAGRGERMRPLTDRMPKSMLQVNGKPLIQYHVENLVQSGILDIVINHAQFGDQIEGYLGNGKIWGARISYSPEDETPLDTAGGIVQALPLLGEKPFITVNADIWTDFPFHQLLAFSEDLSNYLAHIVLVDNPAHNAKGDFSLCDNRVLNKGDSMLTFSGISVFKPEFFKGCASGCTPLAPLVRQAASQRRVSGSHYQGQWRDIGTPERLQELRHDYNVK